MNSKIKKLKALLISTIGLSAIALTAPVALVSCASTSQTESTNPPIINNMSDYTPHTSNKEIIGFHGYTYPANTNFYSFENSVSRPITSSQKSQLMKGLGIENTKPAANNMKYNTKFENIEILEKLVEDVDFLQETGKNDEFISHENLLLDSIDHDNVVTIVGYKEGKTDTDEHELVFQMFYDEQNARNADNILIDSDVFTFRMMFHDDQNEQQAGRPQPIIDFESSSSVVSSATKDDNGYTYPANTKIHKYELTENIKLTIDQKTQIFNNLSLSQATSEKKTRYNYNFKNVKMFEDIIKGKTFKNTITNSTLSADQINTSVIPSDDLLSYVGFRNKEETSETYDELLLQVFPDMNNNKSWNNSTTDVFMLSIKFDEELPKNIVEWDNNATVLTKELIHDNGYKFPENTRIHEYSYEKISDLSSETKEKIKTALSLNNEMTDQKTKYNKNFRDVNILKAIIQDKTFIGETISNNLNFNDISANIIENSHLKSYVGFRDKTETKKEYDEIVVQIFPDMNNNKTWFDKTTDVFMLSLKYYNDEQPDSIINFEQTGFTTSKETIGDNGYKYPQNTKMHTYSATIDKELTNDEKREIIQSLKLNDELSKDKRTYYNNNFRDSDIFKKLIKDLTFKNVMTNKTISANDIKTDIIKNRNLFSQIGFNDKRISRKRNDEIYVYVNPKLDENKTWKDNKTDVFSLAISFK